MGSRGIAILFSLTKALDGGVCGQRHAPVAVPPEKTARAHFTRGYLGLGASLDSKSLYDSLTEFTISLFHITLICHGIYR